MEYEELLNRAVAKLPKQSSGNERFEVPQIDGFIQGNQTVIKNFGEICKKLRREPKHVLKNLAKTLAAPATFINDRGIFQSKLQMRLITTKLNAYVKKYVLCPICHRPDTNLTKEGRVTIMKCQACGARHTIK
jgi:translation initiation factor 2 subunit 2